MPDIYAIFWLIGAGFVVAMGLATTLAIKVAVAAAFRVGSRGMEAVALVNVLTNPALTMIAFGMYALAPTVFQGATGPNGLLYLLITALEVAVVLVEWRLMVWALNGTAGSSRKLLMLSITMNTVSACLAAILFWSWGWI